VCFCWNKLRWHPAIDGSRLHIEPWESGIIPESFLAPYFPDMNLENTKKSCRHDNRFVRVADFTAITMKNAVFRDLTPSGCC
jgi:hypothetical protein